MPDFGFTISSLGDERMGKAIVVKFLGPTDKRSAKWKCKAEGVPAKLISREIHETEQEACEWYAQQNGWEDRIWIEGKLPDQSCVFVNAGKKPKVFVYDSCGETLSFAESLGWEEADNWPDGDLDEFEHDALEYIKSKGYVITEQGENK